MIASGMVLSNLLYVVGAIVAATVVSAVVLLRHRRPKSLEAGIEMFSRELRALQPDGPGASVRGGGAVRGSAVQGGGGRGRTVNPLVAPDATGSPVDSAVREPADEVGRNEAQAPSPYRENGSG